ncbi:MAG: zinc-ribbon domain-containing protein [Pseudomonadota bacterium]
MRISCPECLAQYDVDIAMIPEIGRNVQCSNCAHTWFQTREETPAAAPEEPEPQAEPETEETVGAETEDSTSEVEAAAADSDPSRGDTEVAVDEEPPVEEPEEDLAAEAPTVAEPAEVESNVEEPVEEEPAAMADMADESLVGETADVWDDGSDAIAADGADFEDTSYGEEVAEHGEIRAENEVAFSIDDEIEDTDQTSLNPDVTDILREEAALEVTQRRSEDAPSLEPDQPDLGLGDSPPSDRLRTRLDRMRGEGPQTPNMAATMAEATRMTPEALGIGRDKLPDIEEINSSLRPSEPVVDPEEILSAPEVTAIRRSGFRVGFSAIVLLAAVLVGLYVYAPTIANTVPAMEPAMIAYVEAANHARDGIDGLMSRAIDGINGLVSETTNGA